MNVAVHSLDLRELRRLWWRQRRAGVALPAEVGVILIRGDKPEHHRPRFFPGGGRAA